MINKAEQYLLIIIIVGLIGLISEAPASLYPQNIHKSNPTDHDVNL